MALVGARDWAYGPAGRSRLKPRSFAWGLYCCQASPEIAAKILLLIILGASNTTCLDHAWLCLHCSQLS